MIDPMETPAINPENLAYWYFRLNGFMTTANFVVHPDEGQEQQTEVDVLGVRFPYRAELLEQSMEDDSLFTVEMKRPYVVIAEVKTDQCKLNGPWTKREKRNMHRVLAGIGVVPPDKRDAAADALYEAGEFQDENVRLSLCCVGASENPDHTTRFPLVRQILWPRITDFIFKRFRTYYFQKIAHKQWDRTGQLLWNLVKNSPSADEFGAVVKNRLRDKTAPRPSLD